MSGAFNLTQACLTFSGILIVAVCMIFEILQDYPSVIHCAIFVRPDAATA